MIAIPFFKASPARLYHCNMSNGNTLQVWGDNIKIKNLWSGKRNATIYQYGSIVASLCDFSSVVVIEHAQEGEK